MRRRASSRIFSCSVLGVAMTNSFHPNISDEHYEAFGMITNVIADIDSLLNHMIMAIVRKDAVAAMPILMMLNAKDKRDYLIAMMKTNLCAGVPDEEFEKLMSRLKTASDLRNRIAHNRWKSGRRKGAIKPMILSARENLKVVGLEDNEKEWTAKELTIEADKFSQLGADITAFAVKHDLLRKDEDESIAEKTADSSPDNSKSDKG
jgi:hypothetical protein